MRLNANKPPRRVRSVTWFPIFVSVFLRGVCACGQSPSNTKPTAQPKTMASEHVGSMACAACHKQIYNNYSKTGMGRSMSLVMPEILKAQPTSGSIEDKNTGLHFDVYARDGQLFQSEYELDSNGKEIFRDTRTVEWIIGAGENGLGGLVRQGDYVFQAPLSFYSKAQRWELSPGYELANTGFNRPILPVPTPQEVARKKAFDAQWAALSKELVTYVRELAARPRKPGDPEANTPKYKPSQNNQRSPHPALQSAPPAYANNTTSFIRPSKCHLPRNMGSASLSLPPVDYTGRTSRA